MDLQLERFLPYRLNRATAVAIAQFRWTRSVPV